MDHPDVVVVAWRCAVNWRMVLPAIDVDATRECLASAHALDLTRVTVVNNSPRSMAGLIPERCRLVDVCTNVGVAGAWNIGAAEVIQLQLDLLLVASTSIRFGDLGGADLAPALDLANEWGIEFEGMGWHLIGFTRRTLETVGLFDAGFWPAYFEDTDYLYRMGLAGVPSPRENGLSQPFVKIDAVPGRNAATITDGHAVVDMGHQQRRYVAKWGGPQGSEAFRTPWNSERSTP